MSRAAGVILVFVDGVGIGPASPAKNPLVGAMPVVRALLGGDLPWRGAPVRRTRAAECVPARATLGVPGLPQSGTGQVTLLTGRNAARIAGRHFGPYPYSTLRPMLAEENLFVRLMRAHRRVHYANAFPPRYFSYMEARPTRRAAISSAWLATGLPYGTADGIDAGTHLSGDITGERWNRGGFPAVAELTASEAGRRLARTAQAYDLTLFEFWETDHAGHSGSMEEARAVLARLDEFLGGILDTMDHARQTLLLTSDHGNLEDLSVKTHTRNPVPLIAAGRLRRACTERVGALERVAPALLEALA